MYSQNNLSDGGGNGITRHAKLKLPSPQNLPKTHPFLNQVNHDSLLEYIQQRLLVGRTQRDMELDRLVTIDKNVAGWMRLSDEDKKRERANNKTGNKKPTNINLPLAFVHLDDMMTYFAQTFAPTRGMFYQMGDPDEVDGASQIVTIMNNHAIWAGYYREVLLGIYSLLKYNQGGFYVAWSKEQGPKIVKNPDGTDQLDTQLRWQGNRLEAIDKYNFLMDPNVHPTKLHEEGEFAARVKMRSYYWLQRQASQGMFFNVQDMLDEYNGAAIQTYYRHPPQQAQFEVDESGGTDWKSILGGGSSTTMGGAFELTEVFIRLNPTEFGLIGGTVAAQAGRNQYETWRFTICNNRAIIDATYMNNIHGYLPFFMGVLNDDVMGTSQKSTGEILSPLQDFASFLLNTHMASSRKNLWGLTIYDPTMVDLKKIPDGEVSARIPMNPSAFGRDVRTGIWEHGGTQDTSQTMKDLAGVMDIINQFFPTQSMPGQIASIDRAVDSQVAAVQQGVNRRQQKAARLLDDSVFRNVRFAMYYNIIQYQPDDASVMDFYTGKPVSIDLDKLRDTDLPFIIGQGLKAIDRQAAAKSLQQVIFALIQAPQAAQGIDLLGLIDYWTNMIDIDVDMKQFAVQPPAQAQPGTPAVDPQTGQPIQPAYAPAGLTAPLHRAGSAGA